MMRLRDRSRTLTHPEFSSSAQAVLMEAARVPRRARHERQLRAALRQLDDKYGAEVDFHLRGYTFWITPVELSLDRCACMVAGGEDCTECLMPEYGQLYRALKREQSRRERRGLGHSVQYLKPVARRRYTV